MPLFNLSETEFTPHGGGRSRVLIDCTALTGEDWEALALLLAERLPPFAAVVGVPRGGLPLADRLRHHARALGRCVLLVDDVLTTGRSMEEARRRLLAAGNEHVHGAVVFARGPLVPDWVTPLFRLTPAPSDAPPA
jgi:orotate phosphoribosyltransferase